MSQVRLRLKNVRRKKRPCSTALTAWAATTYRASSRARCGTRILFLLRKKKVKSKAKSRNLLSKERIMKIKRRQTFPRNQTARNSRVLSHFGSSPGLEIKLTSMTSLKRLDTRAVKITIKSGRAKTVFLSSSEIVWVEAVAMRDFNRRSQQVNSCLSKSNNSSELEDHIH